MKDTIITKIIPNTHKSILLFLLFTFFLGFFIFIALLEGFEIDRLTLSGVKIEKLYLKWDNALHIKASKLDLSNLKSDGTPTTLKPLSKLPKIIRWVEGWVDSIHIDIIQYKKLSASLHYQKNQTGVFTFSESNASRYSGTFDINATAFHFNLPSSKIKEGNLSVRMDLDLTKQRFRGNVDLVLPQTPRLTLTFLGDTDTLRLSAHATSPFTTIKPLIEFLNLDPEIKPWILEYAKASSIQLNHLSGSFHYDTPRELITSLVADATLTSGEYTFATGFEPIYSPRIDLRFVGGKLYILPKNGTFYSLPTEQSYLNIDFASEHTTLNAFIRTRHAKLNDPILALLNFYEIRLPIKQISGDCSVDLNLSVNLHDFDTVAKGSFSPSPSDILLDQIPLRTEGGVVKIDRYQVTFNDFVAHYGDNVAHARVRGKYDAFTEKGEVSIDAYELSPAKGKLTLFDPKMPLHVSYIIEPNGDSLNVEPSQWNFLGEKLTLDAFTAPFDYRRSYTAIESVPFSVSNNAKGTISATFDGIKKNTEAKVRLNEFKYGEMELHQSPFDLNIRYADDTARLNVATISAWSIHQLPLLISPFDAVFRENQISFDEIETVLGDLFKGSFSGSYNLSDDKGVIRLENMVPLSPKMVPIIDRKESLELTVAAKDDALSINAPSLKAHFLTIPKGWKIALENISLLSKKSPILRKYNINNGFLNIYYLGESSRYHFNGEIDYLYPLMLINETPISHYRFSGSHQNDTSTIRVNDRLTINQTPDNIYIRANNTGLNLPVLFKFLSAYKEDGDLSTQSDASAPVRIYATHSYLYLMKGRQILTDTLNATLHENNFDASLQHMGGTANLKIRNDLFSIEGEGFNDKFMDHLFALSDFSGGNFSFQAKGKTDSFSGLMRVENTILKDYKVLNNVLAFINTVPSLATFSLPNYNAKGLPLDEGYAHFSYKNGMVSVDNFTLNSPEMKIMGNGRADLNTNQLDGTLNLKTDLGSSLGKVPMVGYILLGDDGSLSTTLTLSGKLDDPKIDTAIAKEIVTAPFNILKRTVVYPFLWMMDDKKEKR
ncbi:AsmA-like C-terminal domain-containing protein [Sulfuricurvum sp.]|uniref:YhdP family protein n=1 Tax=Sulfuricurvum sp. TaxID=2025608 RepID=UPI002E352851|nr:AsmA-like C-terminal domain-containing protein [Sulfuricurvum sp.]HEX5330848.1 AsmA-like C-terminal domain-containing protein [Sulfuricurvum sp.]